MPQRLTFNGFEERAPDVSPDGTRIVFMCRIGDPANPPPAPQLPTFEICVINADGTGEIQRLTNNRVGDATPNWSPDGQQIVFHRDAWRRPQPAVRDQPRRHRPDDPTDQTGGRRSPPASRSNLLASWDLLRVKVDK